MAYGEWLQHAKETTMKVQLARTSRVIPAGHHFDRTVYPAGDPAGATGGTGGGAGRSSPVRTS